MPVADTRTEGEPHPGTLQLFLELPDEATRRERVAEALETMRAALLRFDPETLTAKRAMELLKEQQRMWELAHPGSKAPKLPPGLKTKREVELRRARIRGPHESLRDQHAAAAALAAQREEAMSRGDAAEADRLFRELVIARWNGEELVSELWSRLLPPQKAIISDVQVAGLGLLQLVAQTGHSRGICAIGWSPDGRRLVTADDAGRVIAWDAAAGHELRTWWADEAGLRDVARAALAPDGRVLALGDARGEMVRWGPPGEAEPFAGDEATRRLSFSTDGSKILLAGRSAAVWQNERDVPRGPELAGSPDGAAGVADFAGGGDLFLVERESMALLVGGDGTKRGALEGHAAPLRAGALSADGARAATLDATGTLRVFDTASQAVLRAWKVDGDPVSMSLSADGRLLLTRSAEAGIQLWEVDTDPPAPRASVARALAAIAEPIRAVALSPSAGLPLIVAGTQSGALTVIDATTGEVTWSMPAMRLAITRIAFSADGQRVNVRHEDGLACDWDCAGGRLARAWVAAEPPPASDEVLRFERVAGGYALRAGERGEAIGHYVLRKRDELRLAAFSASRNRILLLHADGSICVFDVERAPAGWPSTPPLLWSTRLRHAESAALSPDGRVVLAGGADGVLRAWDAAKNQRLFQAIGLPDGGWAVADDQGRFDAMRAGAAAGMHWVLDGEPIELSQLKERYYDPFLLAKVFGFNGEPLRDVGTTGVGGGGKVAPMLFPAAEVEIDRSDPRGPRLHVSLTERGGGIGPSRISINGKEAFVCRLVEDATSKAVRVLAGDQELSTEALRDAAGAITQVAFSVSIANHPYLLPGANDRIDVVTADRAEQLTSRDLTVRLPAGGPAPGEPPQLWAIVAGVSTYAGPALRLRYAAKDAEDFAAALALAGPPLFGEGRVHLRALTTERATAEWPTRANLEAAFGAARAAKSGDILVVYLAGHGTRFAAGGDDDYHYIAQDAVSGDIADPEVRRRATVSSEDLVTWIKEIPALKQVLILDTCHAGQVAADLSEKRAVPSSQMRAIERMKDRTGLFILAGAAADAVSFEASRYAQGLLTYALLFGMRGPALIEGKLVDVDALLRHAVEQVPRLAEGIGGVQRPVIAVPRAASTFYIGELAAEAQARVPLAAPLPVVVRSSFHDDTDVDPIDLGEAIDEALRGASGKAASFAFVEANKFPDAYKLAGRYEVQSGQVVVKARLFQGKSGEALAEISAPESGDAAAELARRILEQALPRLRALPDNG